MSKRFISLLIILLVITAPAFAAITDEEFVNLCKTGTLSEVVKALKEGANPNAKNKETFTALIEAARRGSLTITQTLLDAGADVNLASQYGFTPLMASVCNTKNANPLVVDLLIDNGADINTKAALDQTALFMASIYIKGQPEIIKSLVRAGANINITSNSGKTALDYARVNENFTGSEALARLEKLAK